MGERPDIDEAIKILQAGGFKITGGKYAPKSDTAHWRTQILEILNAYYQAEKNVDSSTVVSLLPYAKKFEALLQTVQAETERAARIDELEHLIEESETITHNSDIFDRIAALTNQKPTIPEDGICHEHLIMGCTLEHKSLDPTPVNQKEKQDD